MCEFSSISTIEKFCFTERGKNIFKNWLRLFQKWSRVCIIAHRNVTTASYSSLLVTILYPCATARSIAYPYCADFAPASACRSSHLSKERTVRMSGQCNEESKKKDKNCCAGCELFVRQSETQGRCDFWKSMDVMPSWMEGEKIPTHSVKAEGGADCEAFIPKEQEGCSAARRDWLLDNLTSLN